MEIDFPGDYNIENNTVKRKVILFSPFLIITINHLVALWSGKIWGAWAYIPVMLSNWILFAVFIYWGANRERLKRWLSRPKPSRGWAILSLSMGLLPLPIFLLGWKLLAPWFIWMPWMLIALINPWLEEFYWRGLLIDIPKGRWGVFYSSVLFAVNHPLSYGVNSDRNNGFTIAIVTFVMGLVWAYTRKHTESLRWPIVAHFIVDLISLSAVVFLNLI